MVINDIQFNADLMTILTDLQAVLRANDSPLLAKIKDSGDNIMISCPYHGNGVERRPSAGIHKETGEFHCFACQTVHTLPEVISFCLGYYTDDFGKQGWKWLLQNYATLSVEVRNDIKLDYARTKGSSSHRNGFSGVDDTNAANLATDGTGDDDNGKFVSEQELEKYRYNHKYWEYRGITADWLIELFDLGYDAKTACVTFPVRDYYGRCVFVAKRSIYTKYFHYPKLATKPLYGLYELFTLHKFPDEIYVTESMLDALSLWQVGRYAVALNGVGSEKQYEQLNNLPCRKLILATDADEAGRKARQKLREKVKNKLITEVIFPKGKKDANECTREELENLQEVW